MRFKFTFVLFLLLSVSVFSQQFFKPVPKDLFTNVTTDRTFKGNSVWFPRPAVTLSAVQWNWDKEAKMFSANAFQSVGLGVGYQYFKMNTDGTPYNLVGINALMLLGTDISAGVTVSGFGILNIGATYNFSQKAFGILTGVQLKF